MSEQQFVENTWNSIQLGSNKGYSITNYAVSTSWYNKNIENNGTRLTRLRRYNEADCNSVEISRALDIMAEDISSCNADEQEIFYNEYSDEEKIKKTKISVMLDMLNMWSERTEMEFKFFDRVRRTLKYGITFYKKNPDGTLTELPTERMVGYILSEEDETRVTHYIYRPNAQLIEDIYGTNFRHKLGYTVGTDVTETYSVNDLVIFKIGEKPFGESIIERVYGLWKKLSMLEDALVIYRVVRAPERRVYYIDVGNLNGPKREAAIEKQRLRLMQKQTSKKNDLTTEYDPHSTSEDIFIPTNSTGKGSRVETLPGGQTLGETRDLEWFHRQLAAGLRIPFSMLDVSSPESGQNTYNDMRVGQVYQVEMRYVGNIKRLQKYFERPLYKNFMEFCIEREIIPPKDYQLRINQPSSFAKYKQMEVNQALLNVAGSTLSFTSLSKKYVMEKYLDMEKDEIIENEISKLLQMGIPNEKIKDMPEEDVSNLVYAEQPSKKILQKYGIDAEEDQFGAGRF